MLVREYINERCSMSIFCEMRDKDGYWKSCFNFYEKNKITPVEDLTYKQKHWLRRIKEDLISEAKNV